jgi:hypothetical protein
MKRLFPILVLILTTAVVLPALCADTTGATATPDHIVLTWTDNPAVTQTITWRTDTTVASGYVRYQAGTALSKKAKTAPAASLDFTTDLGTARLFTAKLTDLKPNTKYAYCVGSDQRMSETYTFSTADPKADHFKFLVFGDSQSGIPENAIYQPWGITIHNAADANKDAKFLINMGDMVEIGASGDHWNNWFTAAQGVIESVPEMPVQGNHETYGFSFQDASKPYLMTVQFPVPQNGPDGLKGQVYSYDYGPVHFDVLDSQEEEESPKYGDILKAQKTWLDADLAASHAVWKIALFHKTPYYNKASRTNEPIKAAFCPIFDKYHVDFVLNGHDHGVGRTYAIANDEFMEKPSQGTIYYTTGRSGNKSYGDLSQKIWDTFFYDPQDQPNYLVMEASSTKFTIETYKQDGTLVDAFFVDKTKDIDSDTALHPVPNKYWSKFAKPVLAIYGNIVGPTISRHDPMQRNGVWYVDANAFAASVGLRLAVQSDSVTFSQARGRSTTIAMNDTLMDGTLLVSVEALKKLGFSSVFHPENNILSMAK